MKIGEFKELSNLLNIKLEFNYDLKKKNWFNIGGKAKVYFKVDTLKDLIFFLKKIDDKEKKFIIGAGSNILITDEIYDGIIIKLGKSFSNISLLPNGMIVAGASVLDKKVSEFALENGIGGFEFLFCIPGTVGGGLRMNAGCFNREFKDILISVQALDKNGKVVTIPAKNILFDYRDSNLPRDLIFLSATFQGQKKDKTIIKNEMNNLKSEREKSQPTRIKTSGSTFKNPINQTDKKVWQLIKDSVPKNLSFGDACISEKHSNFFINKKNASFKDMKKLIDFVQNSVKKKTGIKLEMEIKILE